MLCKLQLDVFFLFPFFSVSLFLHALVNNCISFSIFLLIFNKSSCIIVNYCYEAKVATPTK